jgi:hypothetical protein
MSTNDEPKGFWLHKESGEVFSSLRVLPIERESEAEFAKPYVLRNERHMRQCNEKEFNEQFVKL